MFENGPILEVWSSVNQQMRRKELPVEPINIILNTPPYVVYCVKISLESARHSMRYGWTTENGRKRQKLNFETLEGCNSATSGSWSL